MDSKKTITLRISSDLLATLRAMAAADDRSLNAIIVRLLRRAVEQEQGK